jgi:hypothetical protein
MPGILPNTAGGSGRRTRDRPTPHCQGSNITATSSSPPGHDHIEPLGGHLEINAVFDDIKVPVALATDDNQVAAQLT